VWVLTTAPADATLAAVVTTEISSGKDITPFLLPSSKIPSYDADKTTSEYSIAQGDEILAPIGTSYSGSFDVFRDFTAGVPSASDPLAYLVAQSQVWVVVREGLPYTTAATAAQKISVYQFTVGTPQRKRGSNQGFLKVTVPLLTLGNANENAAIS
jgi:hypothetical protein